MTSSSVEYGQRSVANFPDIQQTAFSVTPAGLLNTPGAPDP